MSEWSDLCGDLMYSKLDSQTTTMGVLRTKDWLLCLADFLWSAVVIAPLVVLYWRGSWDLLDDLVRGDVHIRNLFNLRKVFILQKLFKSNPMEGIFKLPLQINFLPFELKCYCIAGLSTRKGRKY